MREDTLSPKLVPDSSVIIEGLLSARLTAKESQPDEVLIHEGLLAYLESLAQQNKAQGVLGLEELQRVKEACERLGIRYAFGGRRPGMAEVGRASAPDIDAMVRELAFEESAHLITADKVQARVCAVRGVQHTYLHIEQIHKTLKL